MLKDAYTAKEVAELSGVTERTISRRATIEQWPSRPRTGRGGGVEYPLLSMPSKIREQIAASLAESAAPAPSTLPAIIEKEDPFKGCNARQRKVANARIVFVQQVEMLAVVVGKTKAIEQLAASAAEGTIAPYLASLIPVANDKYKAGNTGLTVRGLFRWCSDFKNKGEAGLVPQYRQKDMTVPPWANAFLKWYQKPQNPSIQLAYNDFVKEAIASGMEPIPSLYAVRRFLDKMELKARQAGRVTGNAMLHLKIHKKRSTADLLPGDVYTADGTTFDGEIQHPYTGQPLKPEVTIMIDVATRRLVGMSLGMSESAMTVFDALRVGCQWCGIPALLYTDNGSGYKNKLMQGAGIGLLARLGIEMTNSIPGRPQGKGLMERAVKTICTDAAKRLPTYTGKDMDDDAARRVYKLTRKEIKEGAVSKRRKLLPQWDDFRKHMIARVDEYNNRPHRALPMITDEEQGIRRHLSPNEMWQRFVDNGWEPAIPPASVCADLYMPCETRMVHNGHITFYKGDYFAAELDDYHRQAVEIRYDIWDASVIHVYEMQGKKICVAELDGNTIPYFPASRIEAARENRDKAALKRLEVKAQRIDPAAQLVLPEKDESHVVFDASFIQPQREKVLVPVQEELAEEPLVMSAPTGRRPIFTSLSEKYQWLIQNGMGVWSEADKDWLYEFVNSRDYHNISEFLESRGFGWSAAHEAYVQKKSEEKIDAGNVCADGELQQVYGGHTGR